MEPLLKVENLKKYFPIRGGVLYREVARVHALDDVSFEVAPGETLGIVGESGCGKSTLGRSIAQLYKPTSGQVVFMGQDLCPFGRKELRPIRKKLQMIFQDPYESLNPRLSIEDILMESYIIHNPKESYASRVEKIKGLLKRVGLPESARFRYPHEFSGGQRQRIGIARAISQSPKLIICDEPVSALDVSIQSQIINLLLELQVELSLSYIFISHDLSVVRHISDRIVVMYLGKIVEVASSDDLYENPCHPYTKALISAIPVPDPMRKKERIILEGDVPSPISPPSGCRFRTRCSMAKDICREKEPPLVESGGRQVACHFAGE